jgi:hypothetical protein
VALEQEPVRLHDPIDAFDVDCGAAVLLATRRISACTGDSAGRLLGHQLLDLGQELTRGLRLPAAAARWPSGCLGHQVRPHHPERIGDRFHGVSSALMRARVTAVFWLR